MQRIAIITKGFTGSTLPLARELVSKDYCVDLYLLTYTSIHDLEALNCCFVPSQQGLFEIPRRLWKELDGYIGSDVFNLYCVKLPRPLSSMPILRNVVSFFSNLYTKRICRNLKENEYEMFYFSCGYYSFEYIPFLKILERRKCVVGLHEVCNHFNPDFDAPSKLLKYLFFNDIKIVVHSEKSYRDIQQYKQVKRDNINLIHFGLFTSYRSITPAVMDAIPKDYFLFFGVFRDYKGLSLLYDAVSQIDVDNSCKCVVAGSGHDPVLDNIRNSDRFKLIHKFLTNEELVSLIENAKFIVCPYLTVSQSGIPQTAFVFGKPIIASDLEGLNDVVVHEENGLLFGCKDSEDLANSIMKLYNSPALYDKLVSNAERFEKLHPEYSWDTIAKEYLALIERM